MKREERRRCVGSGSCCAYRWSARSKGHDSSTPHVFVLAKRARRQYSRKAASPVAYSAFPLMWNLMSSPSSAQRRVCVLYAHCARKGEPTTQYRPCVAMHDSLSSQRGRSGSVSASSCIMYR